MNVNPYLNFAGTTEEAFNFYKSVFGGEFITVQRFKDIPGGSDMAPQDQEKIMHISLPIGKDTILMATDTLQSMGQTLTVGNNVHICLEVDSKEEADDLFARLANGGQAVMPMEQAFWGAYFGMCIDPFGVQWMISYDSNRQA